METRVRTLVVEDDRATRMLLEDWVRTRPELELCPWSAADGEEGMRLIRDWQPQLVLLDLIMPQCSGISLLRELERDPPPVRPASWSSPRWAVSSLWIRCCPWGWTFICGNQSI